MVLSESLRTSLPCLSRGSLSLAALKLGSPNRNRKQGKMPHIPKVELVFSNELLCGQKELVNQSDLKDEKNAKQVWAEHLKNTIDSLTAVFYVHVCAIKRMKSCRPKTQTFYSTALAFRVCVPCRFFVFIAHPILVPVGLLPSARGSAWASCIP